MTRPERRHGQPTGERRRVVVLAGGLSHEREVSLHSGRRVSGALRRRAVEVVELDAGAGLLAALLSDPPDCVVPLLHGASGEDGAIREVLELLGLPYVGSRPAACRLAFDKPVAKTLVAGAGLRTPAAVALPADTFKQLGAATVLDATLERLGLPLVVKPARGGSALGCSVVRSADGLPAAMVSCFAYDSVALVERLVTGTEVAVTVVDLPPDEPGPRALPPVEIHPDGGVYDYAARYTAGATEFVVPAELEPDVGAACQQAALTAHTALGLRHLSRSDLLVDDTGVWFLEVNVAPGVTDTSLVPLAIDAAGLDLGTVVADLVELSILDGAAGRTRRSTAPT